MNAKKSSISMSTDKKAQLNKTIMVTQHNDQITFTVQKPVKQNALMNKTMTKMTGTLQNSNIKEYQTASRQSKERGSMSSAKKGNTSLVHVKTKQEQEEQKMRIWNNNDHQRCLSKKHNARYIQDMSSSLETDEHVINPKSKVESSLSESEPVMP